MKRSAYYEWLQGIGELTRKQQKTILKQLTKVESPNAVIDQLEQASHRECPYCHSKRLGKWRNQSGLQRFRCQDCGKCSDALTGTPLARLRHKNCWLDYSQALIDGLTIRKAAQRCSIDKTLATPVFDRFLSGVAQMKPTGLTGIVEAMRHANAVRAKIKCRYWCYGIDMRLPLISN